MQPSTIERHVPVRAAIGLGANLGAARATLKAALLALGQLDGTTLQAASAIYRTAPIESDGPDYLNAVALLDTLLTPYSLLAELQAIESAHGRIRPYPNAARTLDLDLLLYGDERIDTPSLTVPHPRLHLRAFVLRPLADVAPMLVIPGQGPLTRLLGAVADQRVDKLVQ